MQMFSFVYVFEKKTILKLLVADILTFKQNFAIKQKGLFTQKIQFLYHLLTLMSCVAFFLLQKTKEDIFKNDCN